MTIRLVKAGHGQPSTIRLVKAGHTQPGAIRTSTIRGFRRKRRYKGSPAAMYAEHPTCMEIFDLLLKNVKCMTANQVRDKTGKSPGSIKKCLEELVEAGYVRTTKVHRRTGPTSCYSAVTSVRLQGFGMTLKRVGRGVWVSVPHHPKSTRS
jgi:hypothetical protein